MVRNYIIIKEQCNSYIVRFQRRNIIKSFITRDLFQEIKELIEQKNILITIELNNIQMLGENDFDSLNLLARLAKNSNSRIVLNNVSQRMQELIDLIKSYTVFEIDYLKQRTLER